MYRFAANVASKARLAKNTTKQVGSRLAWGRNYTAKDIIYGVEARPLILKGVEELADTVRVTMGPKGGHVVIEHGYFGPIVTKDGVRVANYIRFEDKVKNVGARFVIDVANATNDVAGDGTTYATVLAHAIVTEGCKAVAAGVNEMDLIHGITAAVDAVVKNLKDRARMISSSEEIAQVATISANGDREIGELIAKAMEKVGRKGVISIEDGRTRYNELEINEGMKLESGYISQHFITNPKNQKCELENPVILILENEIKSVNAIVKVMELAFKRQRSLLIVAKDVESEALKTLINLNKLHTGIKVCAIKTPLFYEENAGLHDLAALTGGQVIIFGDDIINIDDVGFDMLGSCKRVTISRHDTVILDGAGDKNKIEERCEEIRSRIVQIKLRSYSYGGSWSEDDTWKFFEERLKNLSGGEAIIKIGGTNKYEVDEKEERVTNALNATKAALEEGILPGGGVALLYASKELDKLQTANLDQKIGVEIIQNALKVPVHTIAANAGVDGTVVVGKLLEQDNPNLGYDTAKGEYADMVKAGIIDPLKVIRTALVDAASVSSLWMTIEAVVVDHPKDKKETPAMPNSLDDMDNVDG